MVRHITGQRFDSTLEIEGITAKLTLEMNIHFVEIDGNSSVPGRLTIIRSPQTDFAGGITQNGVLISKWGIYPLLEWRYMEFSQLRQRLANAIQDSWNKQHWLVPDRGWYRNDAMNYDEALSVGCYVKINDVSSRPHFTAYCIKPDRSLGRGTGTPRQQSEIFRSYVISEGGSWGVFTNTDADVIPRTDPDTPLIQLPIDDNKDGVIDSIEETPLMYRQVTVAHEFSHIIGLRHVNGRGNEDWRYGRNYSQRRQISGLGMDILPAHMRAWKSRLITHVQPRHIHWEFRPHPERYYWQRENLRVFER